MAKPKFDGVVHAVHYNPDGQVAWIRAYLRRGATFSDRILLDRQTLIMHLNNGKRYYAGRRVPLLAGTFEIGEALRVIEKNGRPVVVIGASDAENDNLPGVPRI